MDIIFSVDFGTYTKPKSILFWAKIVLVINIEHKILYSDIKGLHQKKACREQEEYPLLKEEQKDEPAGCGVSQSFPKPPLLLCYPDCGYSPIAEVCWSLVAGASIHGILASSAGTPRMASLV